ncbi:MAG TPA: PilZ domain-containing protein [Candidatus Binatia bacterium]|nr:PilZ domain-containing protein [Candidatus Binatia bacterium]
MNLQSLLLCSDEKIVRVLRRTLGDLEIGVEHCSNSDAALRRLTRERFEAIIVDCAMDGAESVLRSARRAAGNKRAVAVAILDSDTAIRSAFDLGAHFILYKPVSVERAKSSFRAARALMKKERRRNARLTMQVPVEMSNRETGAQLKVKTADIGEGGLAVILPRRQRLHGRWQLEFTLPGSSTGQTVSAEFAWEGTGNQVGLRFIDQTAEFTRELREWLRRNSDDIEIDDPPAHCRLTDLSLGGCYLDVASPFPISTRVSLTMRAARTELQIAGVVRVMHPERGMGVEFAHGNNTGSALENFLNVLTQNREVQPEILVEPEGLETESGWREQDVEPFLGDTLLGLFRTQASLPPEAFQMELQKQRGMAAAATASA